LALKYPNFKKMKKNTALSFLYIIIAYITALYASKIILGFYDLDSLILDTLYADVVATVVIFIFSVLVNNSSVYDPYWSIIPVPIAVYWAFQHPEGNQTRQILIIALILLWSLRLTINWIRSWPNLLHQDWRYSKLKEDTGIFYWPVSFLGIHLFPTLIVFLGMLPVYIGMSSTDPLNFVDFIGAGIVIIAVLVEYFADEQLRTFKRTNTEKGANMDIGLWSKSRHPNYLGEILFWFGLFVFSFKYFINGDYWTSYGVIAMIILFRAISIPMMEKRLEKSKIGYKGYQKKVKALIPNLF